MGSKRAGRRPSGHAVKVLVTGASGLLGREVARLLVRQGHAVTTFQRRPSGVDGAAGPLRVRHGPGRRPPGRRRRRRRHPPGREGLLHRPRGGVRRGECRRHAPPAPGRPRSRRAGPGVRLLPVRGQLRRPPSPGWAPSRRTRSAHTATTPAPRPRPNCWRWPRTRRSFRVAAVRPHIVWGPGDTQLVERVLDRASRGRLPLLDAGAALIDTTYVDNAACGHRRRAAPHGAHPRPGARGQQRRTPPGRRAAGGHLRRGRRPCALVDGAGQARACCRIGDGAGLVPVRPGRGAADDQVPRRAALHRPLVRPARDPGTPRLDPRRFA